MKKEKMDAFETVWVKDIVSESNRKIGGMGNINILAEDIKQNGLTNPPTVVETEEGKYRIVAGRRRIEAVRMLKWKEVPVKITSGDEDHLAAISLSENVNRMEMHPLDEAEYFRRLLEKGTKVQDIAANYDRTIAGIQHRIRLCDLIDGLKMMFRDEKITLTSAALLASLPTEDQEKFLKKHGENRVEKYDVASFMRSVQHCTLKYIADKACAKCKKRTFNTVPGLFDDEFSGIDDVCFDEECYFKKWQTIIEGLITKHDDYAKTDYKIIIDHRSIPKFIPKGTKIIPLAGTDFTLLEYAKYEWTETKKKDKSKTAWLVEIEYSATAISVKRVAYKDHQRQSYNSYNQPKDPVKEYLIDQISVPQEVQKDIAAKVKQKFSMGWSLKNKVRENILPVIITKRLNEENQENLATLYLQNLCNDSEGFSKELFNTILGPAGITNFTEIPEEPLIQKLFMFLIAGAIDERDIPDIDDAEERWQRIEKSIEWRFLQITKDDYIGMYREQLSAIINEVTVAAPNTAPGEEENLQEEIDPQLEDEDEEEPEDAETDDDEE